MSSALGIVKSLRWNIHCTTTRGGIKRITLFIWHPQSPNCICKTAANRWLWTSHRTPANSMAEHWLSAAVRIKRKANRTTTHSVMNGLHSQWTSLFNTAGFFCRVTALFERSKRHYWWTLAVLGLNANVPNKTTQTLKKYHPFFFGHLMTSHWIVRKPQECHASHVLAMCFHSCGELQSLLRTVKVRRTGSWCWFWC